MNISIWPVCLLREKQQHQKLKLFEWLKTNLEWSFDLVIECVSEAGHELGVFKIRWDVHTDATCPDAVKKVGWEQNFLPVYLPDLNENVWRDTVNSQTLIRGTSSPLDLHVGIALYLVVR